MAHPGIRYNYTWLWQRRSRPLYGHELRTRNDDSALNALHFTANYVKLIEVRCTVSPTIMYM